MPLDRHEDRPHIIARNARAGLLLFAVYVVLYGGFVFLAVFKTPLMGTPVPGGMNLAIAYGFFLIVAALVLALVYMIACKRPGAANGTGEE